MNSNEINGVYPRNVSLFQNPKSIRVMQETARLKTTNKQTKHHQPHTPKIHTGREINNNNNNNT